MKSKKFYLCIWLLVMVAAVSVNANSLNTNKNYRVDDYTTSVIFPAGYAIGDYIEFVRVSPIAAVASGYYEVSIAYTRSNIAAAATHLTSIAHANPAMWREVGMINNNGYIDQGRNFTIDCNGDNGNPRFRVRAINTFGVLTQDLIVHIKVRSININGSFVALSAVGNDLTVNKFMPMTNEWDLYVGNSYTTSGASVAIKALENGNIGIGTITPKEKLSVNGKIRAHEIKVETSNWPDYVFDQDYKILGLKELDAYIKVNKHLPDMPSAKEAQTNGVELGEMNKLLLKKVEELTLYLIEKDKQTVKEAQINLLQENKILSMQKELMELRQLLPKIKNQKIK